MLSVSLNKTFPSFLAISSDVRISVKVCHFNTGQKSTESNQIQGSVKKKEIIIKCFDDVNSILTSYATNECCCDGTVQVNQTDSVY